MNRNDMNLNVLIFADDPDLAAELLLKVEEAGPFDACPINASRSGDELQIPVGDIAVIVPSSDAEKTETLLSRLDERGVPAILLGSVTTSGTKPPRAPIDPRDYNTLFERLHGLSGVRAIRANAAGLGAGPVPGQQDAVVDKS